MKSSKWMRLLFGGLIVVLVAGCTSDSDFGSSCPLPEDFIDRNCSEQNASTGSNDALTCVNESHPTCSKAVCLIFRESAPFCTWRCETVDDCPKKATCEETIFKDSTGANKKFCVPANPPTQS
ncbi:MAG: hypothetical protein KC609_04755 [Myxococcales bacterium]|nr:hypothetical protein [Myxococcales bacterium]